ncbi:hypothetical protein EJD97_002742 [Solanum chilense]|uniref:Uncharacterized protein n=1 Tax=Solanum chilense TaxID=4083 RepID=A0A6N2BVV6_SOLCI|nr:hypothetical protein EJD97_002742 [Solanum chilense]
MQKRPPTELMTLVTVRHGYDGPSCRFVMKFREVIPVPRFQELKCFETKTLDGPLYLTSRGMKRAAEEIAKYGTTESMTVRRDHDGPSCVSSTQSRFGRFPANRVLI